MRCAGRPRSSAALLSQAPAPFSLATPAPSRPSAAKIATIIAKARQFDAKDVVTDPDSGSNASDDAMLSVLEDHSDDPVRSELMAIIRGLIEDEQLD